MKVNKNNSGKKATTGRFTAITTTVSNPNAAPEKKHPDFAKAFRTLEENHKITRRYSLDDNGGGYQGL